MSPRVDLSARVLHHDQQANENIAFPKGSPWPLGIDSADTVAAPSASSHL